MSNENHTAAAVRWLFVLVLACVALPPALGLATVGGAITLAIDHATAPPATVPVIDVAWRRTVHYERLEWHKVRVSCSDRTRRLDARMSRLPHHRTHHSPSPSCYERMLVWSPRQAVRSEHGRHPSWPTVEGERDCNREGCVRVGEEVEVRGVAVPGPLGEDLCEVDEATWRVAAPGDVAHVRRSRILGAIRCDGITVTKG